MGFSQGIMPNKGSFVTGQRDVASAGESQPLVTESLTGTLTFTNGSDQVTGSGTAFTSELSAGDFISLDADEVWAEVESVDSDTSLTLTANYSGTGGSGAGSKVGDVTIPDGCWLTIIAKPGNSGTIYLGKTKADVEDTDERFDGLSAGLAHALRVNNANLVWVNSDTNGIGVSFIAEQGDYSVS